MRKVLKQILKLLGLLPIIQKIKQKQSEQRQLIADINHAKSIKKPKEALFLIEFEQLKIQASTTKPRFSLDWDDRYPWLDDKTSNTPFNRHYIYHPAWAARVLKETDPPYHIDISSINYFAALVSAFVPIKFYEYQPSVIELSDLFCGAADLLALPFQDNSVPSLSCMHTIEHVGLGRYSDPIDYDGDLKAIRELQRVLAPNGNLLFVTPVGKANKIMFNAHRIYTYAEIIQYFEGFELIEFALIPDSTIDGGLVRNASKEMSDRQEYGCGCFWFKK